jgi:hypothetical protein
LAWIGFVRAGDERKIHHRDTELHREDGWDRRGASFDELRMRAFFVPPRLPLILSLSKDAG